MCTAVQSRRCERIDVEIPNISSTEVCKTVVEEIIKYVLVNKKVLPYPFTYLKTVNSSRTECNLHGRNNYESLLEERHVRQAQSFYEKMMYIFQGLEYEFRGDNWKNVRLIALLLGPTINCPKEVYLIKVPDLFYREDMKMDVNDKMRHVVLNDDMMKFIGKFINPSNMFVLVLKPEGDNAPWVCPLSNYMIRRKVPVALLRLCQDKNKLRKHDALVRPENAEVDLIINKMCTSPLQDQVQYNKPSVFIQTKQVWPSYARNISSEVPKPIASTSMDCFLPEVHVSGATYDCKIRKCCRNLNSVFEQLDPENSKQKGCSSSEGLGAMNTNQNHSELLVSPMEVDISLEPLPEKLVWYLCTEHLSAFKEPKKTVLPKKRRM